MHDKPTQPTTPLPPTLQSSPAKSALNVITQDALQHWLIARVAAYTSLDTTDIEVNQPCAIYGLDSIAGVSIVGDLEIWLNRRLSPTLLWDFPSIATAAQYLIDTAHTSDLLSHLNTLSDEAVDAMLAQLTT